MLVLMFATPAMADALDEVNAQRAHFGRSPLIRDAALMRFAQSKAEWKAAHLVTSQYGYTGHEGIQPPADCREGTGALAPHWGFVVCRMLISGSHRGGAGIAIGEDGRRYMVVVVGTRSLRGDASAYSSPLETAYMTPNAPRIRRNSYRPPVGLNHPIYAQMTREFWRTPTKPVNPFRI